MEENFLFTKKALDVTEAKILAKAVQTLGLHAVFHACGTWNHQHGSQQEVFGHRSEDSIRLGNKGAIIWKNGQGKEIRLLPTEESWISISAHE